MKQPKHPNAEVHVYACVLCVCVYVDSFTALIPYFPLLDSACGTIHPHRHLPSFFSFLLIFLPSSFPSKTILRAKFSSITAPAILHAFNHLTLPNYNEARSVDARQEVDLRIGCSFTRFQTTQFQVGEPELGAKRWQGKTLANLLNLGIWWENLTT